MQVHLETIELRTFGRGLVEISEEVERILRNSEVQAGLCTVFCPHTSASLVLQENADSSAARDLEAFFDRLAPDGDPRNEHTAEGEDDSPAHMRSAVTRSSESIPVVGGRLALGTWQGIYLFEHRLRPHAREVLVQVIGEKCRR